MAESAGSQLPQDPAYWDSLAQRIRDDAAAPLAAYAATADVWYDVLARRASWWVAASAAAMLIVWLTLPVADGEIAFRAMERLLAPSEPAGTLISGSAPPAVDALMVQFSPAGANGSAR
jgi:hypothetical protein